ncbi:MAG: hypothetical protein K9N29_04435 [Candidatus Marinimicrobia bacterium]|nr:hypothetical protein [Candidatus Neomarinimicrobiota bacterium]
MKTRLNLNATRIICTLLILSTGLIAESGRVHRKNAVHKGNLVKTVFGNWGVVGQPADKGPRGAWIHENNGYVGDVSPFVGAQIITTDTSGVQRTFHSVVVSPVDRPTLGGSEVSPTGKQWGFEPVAGYANPNQSSIAMSTNPGSWPSIWPDHPTWAGTWNGYFGQISNASEESYYVMDDANDEEFNFPEYNNYRVAFKPDSRNPSRNGLGLEVKVRGMQWGQFLAQDVIFWLYEVTNTSTTDYDQITFGMLVGTYIGVTGTDDRPGEYDDDWSFFDVERDLTFTGDYDNNVSRNSNWVGNEVGMVGYAFLESPGNPFDGIDNDRDALAYGDADIFEAEDFEYRVLSQGDELILIDDQFNRSSHFLSAGPDTIATKGLVLILSPGDTLLPEGNEVLAPNASNPSDLIMNGNAVDGIDNDLDGLIDENYYLHYRQVRKDQDGNILFDILNPTAFINYITGNGSLNPMIDEKRDDGDDNDGDWSSEFDDIGSDGVPGTDDSDGTEGNGWPDPGEPNFDATDPDESDQIGLTSFNYFTPAGDIPMHNDEALWDMMEPGYFDVPASIQNGRPVSGEDGDFVYSSGYFPLRAGQTERFSIGLLYGEDQADLIKNLTTVKNIYDSDYRFPTAPLKPTVSAVAGDGYVTLYWDRRAEGSIDPVLKIMDFEGYKIYRATDPNFNDIRNITNSLGVVEGYEFLAQFDLINEYNGPFYPSEDLFTQSDGYTFYLGDDSGLQHSYTDTDVQNGRTYYYAVVAYDRGDAATDIFPSENTKFIAISPTGEVSVDQNTLMIVPGPTPPGYTSSEGDLDIEHVSVVGSGRVSVNVIDPKALKDHVYVLSFEDQATDGLDNDQDWNPANDDVGSDGIAGTNDADGSEGDGLPQNGEPHFEFSDPDELRRLTTSYSVLDSTGFRIQFEPLDTLYVQIGVKNIVESSVEVFDQNNQIVPPSSYSMRSSAGAIRAVVSGGLADDHYTISGQYYPVYKSPYIYDSPFANEAFDSDIFDGMELYFENDWNVKLIDSLTGWNTPDKYDFIFGTTSINLGGGIVLNPIKYPSNYQITFDTDPIYTANDSTWMVDFFGGAQNENLPVNFQLTNVTGHYNPQILFDDQDHNNLLSSGDVILIFDKDSGDNYFYTWNIVFRDSPLYPDIDTLFAFTEADTVFINTTQPFRKGDVFIFQPEIPRIETANVSNPLDDIKVFPNPYVAANIFEHPLSPGITSGRGERRVTFTHVPHGASIHIYTARGDHIRTLENDSDIENAMVNWNLKSKENLEIAYGIYFYVVDTPFGRKTGKLAIVK